MLLTSISLHKEVIEKYPSAKIGIVIANFLSDPLPFSMPSPETLKNYLQEKGMHPSTYVENANIKAWRDVFQKDFNISPKSYRPSIDALTRRVIRGKGLPSILPLVDIYNTCSVEFLLPMGGYDVEKLKGELTLRYGREGEAFLPLHEKEMKHIKAQEIIYADDERVVCWLWNYKDTEATCITKETRKALFCIDSLNDRTEKNLFPAIEKLKDELKNAGGSIEGSAILSKDNTKFAV